MADGQDAPDRQLARWLAVVAELRAGATLDFAGQWARFQEIYADRPPEAGPPIAWQPEPAAAAASNLGRFMAELGLASYAELHAWSSAEREGFWQRAIARLGIQFASPPECVLDLAGGPAAPRWLPGARLNIVDSCFRPERSARTAVVSGREGSDRLETTSYAELERLVDGVARGLATLGLGPGSAVALYMPMTVECVAAYLGVVRAGAAVVSIADSFSPEEVKRRLEIAGAATVITVASYERAGRSVPLYDKVVAAGAGRAVVIPARAPSPARLRPGDIGWHDFLGASAPFPSVAGEPGALTNVLFSSGTTGEPKAIPWTQLTPIKCAADGHFHQDIRATDRVAWPTNIGWMMGPWLIYASLLNGASMALHEGAPHGQDFVRFVRDSGVSVLGVVPSLVRAWRTSGVAEGVSWDGVRVFSSTGEPSNREDYLWLMSRAGYRAPVIEYLGGTEIGGGHITGTVVQPASPATFTTPALGLDFVILDDAGAEVSPGAMGELYLVPPSIGLSERLLNRDHDEVYYAGCPRGPRGELLRRHGDQMLALERGFYRAQGRADDTMNLGGIKVSSLELERLCDDDPAVYESAAVAVQPGGEGAERLVIFAVLATPVDADTLKRRLGRALAERLNPLFKIHDLAIVDRLPRTASNKLMRRELRTSWQSERAPGGR